MGEKLTFRCLKCKGNVNEEVEKLIDYGNRFGASSKHSKCGTKLNVFINKAEFDRLKASGIKVEKHVAKPKKASKK